MAKRSPEKSKSILFPCAIPDTNVIVNFKTRVSCSTNIAGGNCKYTVFESKLIPPELISFTGFHQTCFPPFRKFQIFISEFEFT
jgi:hypothetical protein